MNGLKLALSCAAVASLAVGSVHAVVPTGVESMVTGLGSDLLIIIGYVIGAVTVVAGAILGVRIGPKVVKRIASWF